ncbi:DUF2157 domain-containing protein [Emticicia sp. TH156]|uniref:DUF2157 domain-containing protein n=1 Tax=Emticicia sp. TH156 TaxID=2067454 RepID=UPI000C75D56C|nr:DUF2157 domain-containing protein [Emticicia sp. TH156]PLK45033.1 DUF2157 domain-containing protein [Emticicia sp. TH156]
MKYPALLKLLTETGIIPEDQSGKVQVYEKNKPFSIHWELRTFLYAGIVLLGAGLGTVIYFNIDSIGHTVLISLIVAALLGCLWYAFRYRKPFSWNEVPTGDKLDDFALLAACVLFLTLEGYLQYQYNIFGTRYGLVTFLPAVLFFFLAYRFDHRGVLSMAITAFSSWVGVNIAPIKLWQQKNFSTVDLTNISILLGVVLIAAGFIAGYKKLKAHFAFTYLIFGSNIAFVAGLAGLIQFDTKFLYILLITLLSAGSIWYGRKMQSFVFLLMGVLYGYVAFTYFIFYRDWAQGLSFTIYTLYYLGSAVGIVLFLINIKQIIGIKK